MFRCVFRIATLLIVVLAATHSLCNSTTLSMWSFLSVQTQEPNSPGAYTTNLFPLDRFGNRLSWEEISTTSPPTSTLQGGAGGCSCQNDDGIFDIIFEDVCEDRDYGFDDPVHLLPIENLSNLTEFYKDYTLLMPFQFFPKCFEY